jgi:hypothetical protein
MQIEIINERAGIETIESQARKTARKFYLRSQVGDNPQIRLLSQNNPSLIKQSVSRPVGGSICYMANCLHISPYTYELFNPLKPKLG